MIERGKYTYDDMIEAFRYWRDLPRDSMSYSCSEEVTKAWVSYCEIRDSIGYGVVIPGKRKILYKEDHYKQDTESFSNKLDKAWDALELDESD